MSRNIWIGIVVVFVLVAGGWWYLNRSTAPSTSETSQLPAWQESANGGPLTGTDVAPRQVPETATQSNPALPATVSQLTKTQVMNGYDRCGVQFNNGEISIGYDRYTELERTCSAAVSNASISANEIVLADLDSDGTFEAIVPTRVVRASSGGALYVFKNVNGAARVADSIVIGKENMQIISVNGNIIVGKTDGAMGYTPTTKTYTFVSGRLIEQ